MIKNKIDLVKAVLKKFPGTTIIRWGADMEWNTEQRVAISKAGLAGGQYLDAIGRTDLARMSEDEWKYFIETIIREYETQMVPF